MDYLERLGKAQRERSAAEVRALWKARGGRIVVREGLYACGCAVAAAAAVCALSGALGLGQAQWPWQMNPAAVEVVR